MARVELKWKIQEAVEEFDAKLLNLYKMRVAIEKCILAEELKISLYDCRMSVQDQLQWLARLFGLSFEITWCPPKLQEL